MGMWHRVSGALRGSRVLVYCDGSGEARVGKPGGWAFIVVKDDQQLISGSGAASSTTSLVMELEAALAGLRAVSARGWHGVEVISDSSIALDIAAGKFLPKRHGALALELRAAAVEAKATTRWVRAHSGHRWNEAVDALARKAKELPLSAPAGRALG